MTRNQSGKPHPVRVDRLALSGRPPTPSEDQLSGPAAPPSPSRPQLKRAVRWLSILGLFLGVAMQSPSASADDEASSGGATPTGTGGVVEAVRLTPKTSEGSGGSGNSGGGEPPFLCFSSTTTAEIARQLLLDPSGVRDGVQYVSVTCYFPGTFESWIAAVYPVGDPNGAALLLERAIDILVVPEPVSALLPGQDQPHLVGLPEHLAVDAADWHPFTASAAIPGIEVTLTAEPLETQWDLGNGDTVTCPGPGTPWQPGASADTACTYTYRWSSTATQPRGVYHVTASTIWSRTWQCQPDCGSGSLAPLTRSTGLNLRVLQGQAVISRPSNPG